MITTLKLTGEAEDHLANKVTEVCLDLEEGVVLVILALQVQARTVHVLQVALPQSPSVTVDDTLTVETSRGKNLEMCCSCHGGRTHYK